MIRRHSIELSAAVKSVALAIGTVLAVGCNPVSNMTLVTENACYRPLFTETEPAANLWPDIASVCAAASRNQSAHNVDEIVNALINAGSAERRLGHPPGQPILQGQALPAVPVAAGHFEQAVALLTRAHTLDADRHDATLELAWSQFGQNKLDDAMALTNEVLRVLPSQSSLHATAHYLRGWISDARHDEDAALADWQELASDALDEHPYALEARRSIIEVATRIGLAAMRTQTREGSESAIGYFTRAQNAAEAANWNLPWPIQVTISPPPEAPQSSALTISVYAADIFMNLGDAKLQMAGLTSRTGAADFNCAAGAGDPDWLNRAQQDFDSATQRAPRLDKAWQRLACADLALGRADAALAAARNAVAFAPSAAGAAAAEDYRILGRVLAVTGPADEAASAFQTAAQHTSDNRTRARIHTELAAVYYVDADTAQSVHPTSAPPQNQIQTAQRYLQLAVQEDPSYALAHLRLGIVYFDNQNYASANEELSHVARLAQHQPPPQPPEDLTNPALTEHHDPRQHFGDRPVRAEALYYRSRIGAETEGQTPDYSQDPDIGCPRRGSSCMAIALADEAFRLQAAERYRDQACLVRIRFRRVDDRDRALNYCSTTGITSPGAKTFLLQGMYYLARAHVAYGSIAQDQAWDAADRSFSDGLGLVEAANEPTARRLRALLLQGHATAQYCVGLTVAGHQIEASIAAQLPDQASEAHTYFVRYHIMECPR